MASHEEAALLMDIMNWSNGLGVVDASLALMSPDFDPDSASPLDRSVFVLLLMGETIGTFTKQGLIDPALVNDLWGANLVWARVGPAALRQREQVGDPQLWENFELLARG